MIKILRKIGLAVGNASPIRDLEEIQFLLKLLLASKKTLEFVLSFPSIPGKLVFELVFPQQTLYMLKALLIYRDYSL